MVSLAQVSPHLSDYPAIDCYGASQNGTTREVALRVIRLPFNLYAKDGYGVPVGEAIATQFVSENITIPVPHILDVVSSGPKHPYFPNLKSNLILSTGIPGTEFGLSSVKVDDMSEEQASVFVSSVRGWFAQLRALPPPGHAISGVNGASFLSYRIRDAELVGPFASQEEFHAQYFCTLWEPLEDHDRAALVKRNRRSTGYASLTATLRQRIFSWITRYALLGWLIGNVQYECRNTGNIRGPYISGREVEAAIWKHYMP
ncbi:uncharacterized protein BT62DRAFT_1079844 [Guyanagaster necrorhizus]|uniref:Uncharacterized protein n=1 Tax=Guyanagaster necrorhizus TaxID=856835 RepID=A0A9P7VIH5_9AGAR|nr:uncharacterized protein BT62DRAFT_1079844 [Guyanagaster necrorhizus MCA 3950]KAG7441673.1 hypothetical protein BT62DRAFT_1079844 [Guyanagaster necrorhizus MCA 3950]